MLRPALIRAPAVPATVAVLVAVKEPTDEFAATSVLDNMSEAGDGDAPQWPDEAAEVVFLSDHRSTADAEVVVPGALMDNRQDQAEPAEVTNAPMPALQTLVDRIPVGARDVLEDLFRARFVSVKRVQNSALK